MTSSRFSPIVGQAAAALAEPMLTSVISPTHLWAEILESPEYFLHGVDSYAGNFGFIRTSRERLAKASFIDGRSPLALDGEILHVPIDYAFKWQKTSARSLQPNRFVFHQSFCGSTFLARVLQVEGKSFSYKEPNIIAQLANLKAEHDPLYANKAHWSQLLSFVLSQYKQPWIDERSGTANDSLNLIKPSSWVNSILPDLATEAGQSKVVLMTHSVEDFLVSVFRGGGERVQFVYALLKHMRSSFPDYYQLVAELEQSSLESADLFIRLTLIAHALQNKAFAQLRALLPDGDSCECRYQSLVDEPIDCAELAAHMLDLNLSRKELLGSVAHNLQHHAKVSHRGYAQQQTEAVNAEVKAHYKQNFQQAMRWYQEEVMAVAASGIQQPLALR